MDILIHSVKSVMSIALMVAVGFVLARRGWFDDSNSKLLALLVSKVALPCMVLVNITDNFNRANLHNLFYDLALPLICTASCYCVGCFFCFLLKVPKGRRAVFKTMFYVANSLFIGVPISIALFGEDGAVYAFQFYIVNTITLWTVAVYEIAADGSAETVRFNFLVTMKSIIFSPLLGLFCAILLILLDIRLPVMLKDPLKYMGGMTTPLSMMFIGIALSKTRLSELTPNLEMSVAYMGRFTVGPLVLFAAHQFIPAGELLFKVSVIQSATPLAVVIPAIAATYGLDVKYPTILASTSILLFVVVAPVYMLLLHNYFGG